MTIFQGLVLGLVQGLTEFLPISSSGHLILAERVLGMHPDESLGVLPEVVVHAGTLGAVIALFWGDTVALVRGGLGILRHPFAGPKVWLAEPAGRLFALVFLASLPAVIAALAFYGPLKEVVRDPVRGVLVTGCCLLVTAGLLTYAHVARPGEHAVSVRRALGIGLAQAVALLPGVSRSGSTISMAVLLGVERGEAGRFSFLMSIPVVAGAVLVESRKLLGVGAGEAFAASWPGFLAAFVSAFVVGFLALVVLMRVVRAGRLGYFAPYCAVVGILAILAVVTGRVD